jgi:hypothetical protein
MTRRPLVPGLLLGVTLLLSGCSASFAPQLNPVPYYTYYPASLPVVTNAAERALTASGMRFTGTKAINAQTTEVKGLTANGDAILITLHQVGSAVTKFDARIGLYGHLREVQEIEHWMGQYVGQAISAPSS